MNYHKPIPCIARAGGKRRLLGEILPRIPPHKLYCEPFFGGGAVFFAKEPAKDSVLNDADSVLVNFYRVLMFHREALIAEILKHPGSSRQDFNDLKANPGFTDIQRAARFYLLHKMSFAGRRENFGRVALRPKHYSFVGYKPERDDPVLAAAAKKLHGATLENTDWENIVNFYDHTDTFFFFDPPYTTGGGIEYPLFDEGDMTRLRRRLDLLKGQFLLTVDDSPITREVFAGLAFVEISSMYSQNKSGTCAGLQRLIMSAGIGLEKGI